MVPDAIRAGDLDPIAFLSELSRVAKRGFETGAVSRRRNARGVAWRAVSNQIAGHWYSHHFNRVGRAFHSTTYVTWGA